jgi:hypothetical protein
LFASLAADDEVGDNRVAKSDAFALRAAGNSLSPFVALCVIEKQPILADFW